MKNIFYLLLLILVSQCRPKEDQATIEIPDKTEVPSSIKKTHATLLDQIHEMTLYKDSSSIVAIKLEVLMQHHFKEEEDFILPPLGLLPLLAAGQLPAPSKELLLFCENIKPQLTHMSVEHQLIKAYIEELKQTCLEENRPAIIAFEKEVIKHAVSEEEVFFPAAILVGEYLKLKSTIKI